MAGRKARCKCGFINVIPGTVVANQTPPPTATPLRQSPSASGKPAAPAAGTSRFKLPPEEELAPQSPAAPAGSHPSQPAADSASSATQVPGGKIDFARLKEFFFQDGRPTALSLAVAVGLVVLLGVPLLSTIFGGSKPVAENSTSPPVDVDKPPVGDNPSMPEEATPAEPASAETPTEPPEEVPPAEPATTPPADPPDTPQVPLAPNQRRTAGWILAACRPEIPCTVEVAFRRAVEKLPIAVPESLTYDFSDSWPEAKALKFWVTKPPTKAIESQIRRLLIREGLDPVYVGSQVAAETITLRPSNMATVETVDEPPPAQPELPLVVDKYWVLIYKVGRFVEQTDPTTAIRENLVHVPGCLASTAAYDAKRGLMMVYGVDGAPDSRIMGNHLFAAGFDDVKPLGIQHFTRTLRVTSAGANPPLMASSGTTNPGTTNPGTTDPGTTSPLTIDPSERNPSPPASPSQPANLNVWQVTADRVNPPLRQQLDFQVPQSAAGQIVLGDARRQRAAILALTPRTTAMICDLRTGKILAQGEIPSGEIIAMSSSGNFIAVKPHGSAGLQLMEFDRRGWQARSTFSPQVSGGVHSAKFVGEDRILVGVVHVDNMHIAVLDVPSGRNLLQMPTDAASLIRVSPRGRYAVVRSANNSLHVYDLEGLKRIGAPALENMTGQITDVAFSPTGMRILMRLRDSSGHWLAGWDLETGEPVFVTQLAHQDLGRERLEWVDERFVLQQTGNEVYLIDLKYNQTVWKYEPQTSVDRMSLGLNNDPVGRLWFRIPGAPAQQTPGGYVAYVPPTDTQVRHIDDAFARQPHVLQRGNQVSVVVDLHAKSPRAGFEQKLRQAFITQLLERGMHVVDNAPRTFRVSVRLEQRAEQTFNIVTAVDGVNVGTRAMRLPDERVNIDLEILEGPRMLPWKWKTSIGCRPGIWPREEGNMPPEVAVKLLPWYNAEKWAAQFPLPDTFYPQLVGEVGRSMVK